MASGPWTFSTIAALGQHARHLGPHARRSRRQDLRGRSGICTFTLNSGIWMGLNARNLDPARDGAGVRTFMRHNGIRNCDGVWAFAHDSGMRTFMRNSGTWTFNCSSAPRLRVWHKTGRRGVSVLL